MELKAFIKSLPAEPDEREAFAAACETTLGHLRNVMYGIKPCSPELAVLVERHSAGKVTRQELLPDKWPRIWPELVAQVIA